MTREAGIRGFYIWMNFSINSWAHISSRFSFSDALIHLKHASSFLRFAQSMCKLIDKDKQIRSVERCRLTSPIAILQRRSFRGTWECVVRLIHWRGRGGGHVIFWQRLLDRSLTGCVQNNFDRIFWNFIFYLWWTLWNKKYVFKN